MSREEKKNFIRTQLKSSENYFKFVESFLNVLEKVFLGLPVPKEDEVFVNDQIKASYEVFGGNIVEAFEVYKEILEEEKDYFFSEQFEKDFSKRSDKESYLMMNHVTRVGQNIAKSLGIEDRFCGIF